MEGLENVSTNEAAACIPPEFSNMSTVKPKRKLDRYNKGLFPSAG